MASTTASRKAKGRLLQKYIASRLLEAFPSLHESDVVSRPMGSPGTDIMFSKAALDTIGDFDIESKNQESLNIWEALDQADQRAKSDKIPVVVFKRNKSKVYVAMEFDDWVSHLTYIFFLKNLTKSI